METGGCRSLVVLECANCSLHTTVEGALSETVATVSLSIVPRLSLARLGSGRARKGGVVSPSHLSGFRFLGSGFGIFCGFRLSGGP